MFRSLPARFFLIACTSTCGTVSPSRAVSPDQETHWGVQLAGSFSQTQALATYDRVRRMIPDIVPMGPPIVVDSPYGNRGSSRFYRARVGTASRSEADGLCDMIRAAGASCAVLSMKRRP